MSTHTTIKPDHVFNQHKVQFRHHKPARRTLLCRAEQLPSDKTSQQPSKDEIEVLKRLKRAKQYAAEQKNQTETPPPPQGDDPVLQSLDNYAKQQAQDEQAAFLEAQQQLPPPKQPPPSSFSSSPTSVRERLNKAKQYKQNLTTDTPKDNPPSSTTSSEQQQQQSDAPPPPTDGDGTGDDPNKINTGDADRAYRQGKGTADQAANWLQVFASQGTTEGLDTDMRAEEFTLAKEERVKQGRIEIVTAKSKVVSTSRRSFEDMDYGLAQQQDEAEAQMAGDATYSGISQMAANPYLMPDTEEDQQQQDADADADSEPQQQQASEGSVDNTTTTTTTKTGDDVHNPKVDTWGVFPRPKNISKAYGGGRNLRPGQALESEEDAEARKKRVGEALTKYKKSLGLDVDPMVEMKAERLFNDGEVLFKAGNLNAAVIKFTEAADMMPLRSRVGGQATLQRAICLDSMGKNDEAYKLYKSLKTHSAAGVAKTARRMLYGFEAAQDLKVNTSSFSMYDRQAWSTYFDRIAGSSGWSTYTPTSVEEVEEDQGAAKAATVLAVSVLLVPMALICYILFK